MKNTPCAKVCNANLYTEYASILDKKIYIHVYDTHARANGIAGLGMAERARRITHGRLSKQEPRLPSAPHVCSVPFTEEKKINNYKNEKKQARVERVGFQKSANGTAERWLRGNYSDCGRAHYVVSGICIFGCANCLDVFKYGCASLICLSTSLNVPSLLNQNVNPVEFNGCASQRGGGLSKKGCIYFNFNLIYFILLSAMCRL